MTSESKMSYSLKIDFKSAHHVPIGDFFNGSSDPYCVAIIDHKSPQELTFRTSTCRSTRDPEWQHEDSWVIAGVQEGTLVKCRLFDEDPRKLSNDKIGIATLRLENLQQLADKKEGSDFSLKLYKRKASAKVYFLTYLHSWFLAQDLRQQDAQLNVHVSVKPQSQSHSRPYLKGPIRYSIHFSPILGKMTGTGHKKGDSSRACFLGFQLHLKDVPEMRFPYTRKRKEIVMMYSDGIRGKLIRRALKSQHATIYGFDSRTLVGSIHPEDAAARFLEMTDAASDADSKMFTYAITPDGVMHFTQTGPAFTIQHLSKHAMHANSAKEVVYSGEFFFIKKSESQEEEDEHTAEGRGTQTIIKDDSLVTSIRRNINNLKDSGNQNQRKRDKVKDNQHQIAHPRDSAHKKVDRHYGHIDPGTETPDRDVQHQHSVEDFILVIDNSSGTFMPAKEKLPELEKFLKHNFEGLKIKCMSQDDKELDRLKETRRDNDDRDYRQPSNASTSDSSSFFGDE